MSGTVELDEVPGNVLVAYGSRFTSARYFRLRIQPGGGPGVAALLGRWLPRLTFGRLPAEYGGPCLSVAFTYEGLRALGVPPVWRMPFPDEFRAGARTRAADLGDRWPETPVGRSFEDAHVTLMLHHPDEAACERVAAGLRAEIAACGHLLRVVAERTAQSLDPARRDPADRLPREPFGFSDGRSQPAVAGVDSDPVGDGVYAGLLPRGGLQRRRIRLALEDMGIKPIDRDWRLLRAGEFVLGYPSEDGAPRPGPPAPLGPNGTFMVYRELAQDVETFRAYVAEWAPRAGLDEDALAAKIVGRRKNGSPLVLASDDEDREGADRRRANHFLYAGDPDGFACPYGAHIRRANPRDALPGGAERTMRHRIIRRGLPYSDPGGERGLVFVCYSASLLNGFEFIQSHWLNTGVPLGLGPEPDFMLQQPDEHGRLTGRMVIPGFRNIVLEPPPRPFVTVRGCEYLFVPSRRGCAWLASLAEAPPATAVG